MRVQHAGPPPRAAETVQSVVQGISERRLIAAIRAEGAVSGRRTYRHFGQGSTELRTGPDEHRQARGSDRRAETDSQSKFHQPVRVGPGVFQGEEIRRGLLVVCDDPRMAGARQRIQIAHSGSDGLRCVYASGDGGRKDFADASVSKFAGQFPQRSTDVVI